MDRESAIAIQVRIWVMLRKAVIDDRLRGSRDLVPICQFPTRLLEGFATRMFHPTERKARRERSSNVTNPFRIGLTIELRR